MMRFLSFFLIFMLCGCTADTVKQVAYESLQNYQQQQCQKNLSTDCEPRKSYDHYQQELKSVQ